MEVFRGKKRKGKVIDHITISRKQDERNSKDITLVLELSHLVK